MAYLEVKRKSRLKWWLWLIIIIIVIAIAVFCYQQYYHSSATSLLVRPVKTTANNLAAPAGTNGSLTLI